MTPEERNGIQQLLAGHEPDDATVAWLKRQLEFDAWDNSIEKMGGGRKARDGYMKPIFDVQCAVTGFDMHAQLTTDGRERGLWIWLDDQSKARAERYDDWAKSALEMFCKLADIPETGMKKFSASMAMDQFKNVADAKVHEAALLEWPAVKKLYEVIGKELKKHAAEPRKDA